ncbi:SpoIIE family protein phosphatase [Streptomyces sp. TR02-1]|uniref:SpoIIE family protein phosphatase n=1 Tax=Streptomyces sp. TR02-1 TaxID=3385977 RepID=UPI00399FDBCB
MIEADGTVAFWSREAAALLGHDARDVVGTPARNLLSGRHYAKDAEPQGGAPGGRVLRLRHRDGGIVDLWVRLLPLSGTSAVLALGMTVEELGAWSDTTSMGRSILGQDFWQVALLGPDLRVTGASPAARSGRRLRPGEEDPACRMALQEGEGTGADLLKQVIETGRPITSHVLREPRPGRHDTYYALRAMPLHDLKGQVSGALTSLVDVTDRYRSARRLDILYQASRVSMGSLNVEHTAQGLVDVLVPALGDLAAVEIADATLRGREPSRSVHGLRGDYRRIAAKNAHGPWPADQVQPGQLLPPVPDQPGFRRLEQGEVLVANDPREYRDFLGGAPRGNEVLPEGLRASIGAAIVARGSVLGYVQVYRTRQQQAFDGQDAKLFKEIVGRAALGIDNARRYTAEHRTAVMLQNSLLPPGSATTSAAETAGIYLPAQGEASVGGDWFDVIPLSSLRTALVVGDVIGHGLRASATMARLRTAVQTLAELDLGPDELLTRLDDLVQRIALEAEHPDTTGASCLYAVYDPVTRRCRIASAGHPAPVAVLPDGTSRVIPVIPGPTLGVGGMPFEVTETELPPGSVLALYSDGLLNPLRDTYRDPERELAVRLADVHRPGRGLDETGQHCVRRIRSGLERTEDDVTLLLARTRSIADTDVAQWRFPSDPAAVGRAREAAMDTLQGWGMPDQAFATELVASELVTNAVRYSDGPIGLRLIRDRVLVCEVTDTSDSQPRLRRARSTDEGGRGLFLVAQVTNRWGSRYDTSGKTVWTEQSLERE